jgi:hypothetical protein
VEHLHSKCEALSSNPSTTKTIASYSSDGCIIILWGGREHTKKKKERKENYLNEEMGM